MFVPFVYELRRRKVPVGVQEAVALAEALARGLHDESLQGFYHVARAILIHSEAHLDAFDEAFVAHFRHMEGQGLQLHSQLLDWLKEAVKRRAELSEEERALLDQIDPDELERQLQERLREQTERHDGGSKWVGTGGTSPFGHSGAARKGIRIGGPGGNRSAIRVADARRYQGYRDDLTLEVRHMSVALRKLREFGREGGDEELDVEATIDATAQNAGELEIVTRPPRRPNTRVILLMDVGGSMDPYALLVSRLFTAASKATHFKEFRSYYFHNCVYGHVYRSERFRESVSLHDLMAQCDRRYKLIVVGDALMAPYELLYMGSGAPLGNRDPLRGIDWLHELANHFDRVAWLNPEPKRYWRGTTIETIANVFPMYSLTLQGLEAMTRDMTRGRGRGGEAESA